MSGTDYTQTPNLGLYKPIANRAIGFWGDLWNLNADAIDAAVHFASAGGPYLPLAGNATVFGPTTHTAPLIYTATGGTTSRAAQDRAAERSNVKDFGAVVDGVANDTTAFQAAYTAAPTGSTIYIPPGGITPGMANPARASGNVMWFSDGNIYGTAGVPFQFFGDGDVVESNVGGARKAFYKQLINHGSPLAALEVGLNNKATFIPTNNVASALTINATSFASNTGFTFGINSNLVCGATGGIASQDVGVASTVTKSIGTNANPFAFWCNFIDASGLSADHTVDPASGNSVGMEMDLFCNGPDNQSATFNPAIGTRNHLTLSGRARGFPAWLANHAYAVNTVIQASPTNGFTYICTVAGTSGASQPTWPTTTGTVTDGTVTWRWGTATAPQISRAINVSGRAGDNVQFGSALYTDATYYDAILEFSQATLTDGGAADAAIRLAADMPIDFSGDGTAAGQNKHTLRYRSATQRFYYTVAGVDMWSIDASGNVRARGTLTGSTTP